MLNAQYFDFVGKHAINHDIAFVCHQLVGTMLAAGPAELRMTSQRFHLSLDEIDHFRGADRAVPGDMQTDFDQTLIACFFQWMACILAP
ncbi:hypothetical protein ASF04_16135 [Duganella sp. Leaf61]|nr:hypothetical protein ASF04_16135 [Duganella sp. Leaf61]